MDVNLDTIPSQIGNALIDYASGKIIKVKIVLIIIIFIIFIIYQFYCIVLSCIMFA